MHLPPEHFLGLRGAGGDDSHAGTRYVTGNIIWGDGRAERVFECVYLSRQGCVNWTFQGSSTLSRPEQEKLSDGPPHAKRKEYLRLHYSQTFPRCHPRLTSHLFLPHQPLRPLLPPTPCNPSRPASLRPLPAALGTRLRPRLAPAPKPHASAAIHLTSTAAHKRNHNASPSPVLPCDSSPSLPQEPLQPISTSCFPNKSG